jgi:hypothetical protein
MQIDIMILRYIFIPQSARKQFMGIPHIDSYEFGKIVIDGQLHTKDVILLPDQVIGGWRRQEGHLLHLTDLENVLTADLTQLVVGQGAYSRMRVAAEVEDALFARGIKLIKLSTNEACQEYNRRSKYEVVAAALHLTC